MFGNAGSFGPKVRLNAGRIMKKPEKKGRRRGYHLKVPLAQKEAPGNKLDEALFLSLEVTLAVVTIVSKF